MLKARFFRWLLRLIAWFYWRNKAPGNLQVADRNIPVRDSEIKVRTYTPQGGGPFPVIVFYHGGGFVVGDIRAYDAFCRLLCDQSGHLVASVDYRQAPEYPFPHAAQDALDALDWVMVHCKHLGGDPARVVLAGESAGGNLAAVVAQQNRGREGNPVQGQLLIYPVTHHYSAGKGSYTENGKGYGLTSNMMRWFWDTYYSDSPALAPGQTDHELATPLAVGDLSGLPPALVITAEHDPLRDEGIEYAEKMASNGVCVQNSLHPGVEHGFVCALGPTVEHQRAMDEMVSWLQSLPRAGDALKG